MAAKRSSRGRTRSTRTVRKAVGNAKSPNALRRSRTLRSYSANAYEQSGIQQTMKGGSSRLAAKYSAAGTAYNQALQRRQKYGKALVVGGAAAATFGAAAEARRIRDKKKQAKSRAAQHPTNRSGNLTANRPNGGGKKGRRGHPLRGANGKFAGWSKG